MMVTIKVVNISQVLTDAIEFYLNVVYEEFYMN